MAWKQFKRQSPLPKTSNDEMFRDLVTHFMAKGFSHDEAVYNTEQWTGLKQPDPEFFRSIGGM